MAGLVALLGVVAVAGLGFIGYVVAVVIYDAASNAIRARQGARRAR